jgi:plastocyanin
MFTSGTRGVAGTLAISVALAVASGCGTSAATDPSGATPITIGDNTFAPTTTTVAVGTRLRWTNRGLAVHDVTQQDGAFASGALSAKQTFEWEALTTGSFRYSCTRHDGMSGTIVVE